MTEKKNRSAGVFVSYSHEDFSALRKLRSIEKVGTLRSWREAELATGDCGAVRYSKDALTMAVGVCHAIASHWLAEGPASVNFSSEPNDLRLTPDFLHAVTHPNDLLRTQSVITHQMAKGRALIAERQHADLVEEISRLQAVIKTLEDKIETLKTECLTVADEGCLCIEETHYGTVEKVTPELIQVTYWMADGSLTQTYEHSQFSNGCIPEEGDRVKARVAIMIQPISEPGKDADIELEVEKLGKLATTEPIRG